MQRFWIGLCLGVLTLILTGCFRDAGENPGDTTNINLNDVVLTPTNFNITPSPTLQQVATLTATPQVAPTNTFPAGGPPVGNLTRTATQVNPAGIPTTTPTLIPSFTPPGSTFGDAGVTVTSELPPLAPPDALAPTPTDLSELIPNNACIHLVAANENLLRISIQYNVTVDEMIAANPELAANPNALQVNQQLNIPNCGTPQAPTSTAPTATETVASTLAPGTQTHTVGDGDSLYAIALQYNTTVDALLAANPGLTELIYPGQVITIPAGQ